MFLGVATLAAPFPVSIGHADTVPQEAKAADVIFLGEQHDNPAHHAVQAKWVDYLKPTAVVFEMLTAEQAALVTADNRIDEAKLEAVLQWNASGWPDFSMYYPIFAAAPNAMVLGAAVPRAQLMEAMQGEAADILEAAQAEKFGLTESLPEEQQLSRLALQDAAHCSALPEELLPRMIEVQRLRDAVLAKTALAGFDNLGGPVVVITGNGHAREDWGAPFLLRQAAPDVHVFSLGQGEAGRMPDGGFEHVADGPAVDRGDPCEAFK